MDETEIIQSLEALVIDNPQLDQLESLIGEFNIFEAMGAVRQELRHSDFLGFLLDPHEKHGLGDIFLKRFLIRVLTEAAEAPVSPITINVTRLTNAVVERESQNIDILIHDAESGLVCLIENKIFTSEHSDQLNRYLKIVQRRFPDATAVIPVFLTPDGIPPEEEGSPYIPFSYGQVADILDNMRQAQESMLGAGVNTMIEHYITMLRRYIVTDSDVAELCRQIYQAHKAAIDLIIEHMPDQQQELADYLAGLLDAEPDIAVVRHVKSYVNFVHQDWLAIPEFNAGVGWAKTDATLSLELATSNDKLVMNLQLGPVRAGEEHIRKAIYDYVDAHRDVFQGGSRKLGKKWTLLHKVPLLRRQEVEGATLDEIAETLQPRWERFVEDDLPEINDHLKQITFTP